MHFQHLYPHLLTSVSETQHDWTCLAQLSSREASETRARQNCWKMERKGCLGGSTGSQLHAPQSTQRWWAVGLERGYSLSSAHCSWQDPVRFPEPTSSGSHCLELQLQGSNAFLWPPQAPAHICPLPKDIIKFIKMCVIESRHGKTGEREWSISKRKHEGGK